MEKNIPLYKQIINDILTRILSGDLRPGDRIPSEHELSETYRVSSITSKNALAELSDKGYILRIKGKGSFVNSPEALQGIADYNDTTNQRTIMKAKTIGLVIPSMKTSIDQQLLNAIEMELEKTEYILAVSITRESQELESASIKKLCDRGVSGLIIFPTEHEMYNEDIIKLNLTDFPFVLVDRYLKGIRSSCIYSDNYEISKKAVAYLLDKDCRNIAFLSPNSHNTVTSDRRNGYRDALSERELPIPPDSFCMLDLSITDPEEKTAYIYRYLMEHPLIDGLFCVNREITKYVVKLLTIHDLWGKYRIAAFDYPDDHRITHIRQDIPQIARHCVEELIASIQYGRKDQHLIIPAALIPSEE